jgi:hypothetical protein
MDVITEPVVVSSVGVPLTGTVNATDLTAMYVYYNAAAPTISGATLLNGVVPTFAAPHTYTISLSEGIAAGSGGYFIFTVNTSATAVIGHTVKVDGAAGPVVFGFTTAPNVTNSQTDLGGLQTLPVNLLSLAATATNNTVDIKWTTTAEINNAYFDIERSTDGVHFEGIGKVKAGSTGNQLHDYSFTDREPEAGVNYYRLKQVDLNGTFEYSKVVTANLQFDELRMSTVYPNPVRNTLALSVYAPKNQELLLQVSSISGNILISQHTRFVKGKNSQLLNVSRMAAGSYLLSVSDPETGARLNQRIIIVR